MARNILVVDDSEVVLGVTKTILEDAGYVVATNRRATGSVGLILQTRPDLVLLDVNMPTLRGDMVARMSTATNKTTGTIVVLHSTLPEEELRRLVRECGAHGYIRKTDNSHHLLRQIRRYLDDAPSGTVKIAEPVALAENDPASRNTSRRGSVLLVDKDMTVLSALRRQIQGLGYTPSFALSVAQAVSKLRSELPDVLIASDQLGHLSELLSVVTVGYQRRSVIFICDNQRGIPQGFGGRVLFRPVGTRELTDLLNQMSEAKRESTGS